MGLFSSLNTGYSGLNVNQQALAVTSNNISNASNENYTRERAQIVSSSSIHTPSGDIGMGAKTETIIRVKNMYLFSRYEHSYKELSYNKTMQENLTEIANYFPDIKDVGLNKNIKDYYDAWNNFANNPNDNAVKVDLASKTQTLANTIKETREKIDTLNDAVNDRIGVFTDEANQLIKKIAGYNSEITKIEANNINHANELRDKRDTAEKRLVELTGASVYKAGAKSTGVNTVNSVDYEKKYTISLGGYPLVDDGTYHTLSVSENKQSANGFLSINFEKQDHTKVDITKGLVKHSIIGGLLEFRGTSFDENGKVTNGISGKYIQQLDAFSATLIQHTNSIYAYSAQEKGVGETIFNPISLTDEQINNYSLESPMVEQSLKHPVRDGDLTLTAYDNNGKSVKDIKISIDKTKTLKQNLDEINSKLSTEGVDYKAIIQNGNIVFQKTDTNSDGELSNGALLVKDDGSNLFSAMGDEQFKSITKLNNQDLDLPIKDGSFEVVTYKDNGDELARRKIVVNSNSNDPLYSTLDGILAQINMPNPDDNNDNDSSDDVDDYYKATISNGKIVLNNKTDETLYVGFDNDSSNFGGSIGINQFFSGTDASNISLNSKFIDDPAKLNAYKAPNIGNNDVANDMVQFQYDKVDFTTKNGVTTNTTISGYYRYITTNIANDTELANNNVDKAEALYNTINQEYQSESGVNMDEEMTNLMKFQRGYQAAAKVITTIDSMMDTLMNLKR